MFSKTFFVTNEGALGNACRNGFIRENDFLIREGWMDGVQSGKIVSAYKIYVFFGDSSFGGNTGKVTLQRKSTFLP
jgi:hypothetical protein